MDFQVGDIINGRYRLVSERGRGTFGEVWQAWDGTLDMELNRRNICPSVYGLLLRHGLLYRGVEGRCC